MGDSPKDLEFRTVGLQGEMIAALEDLKARFERGEIRVAALRVYNADGTFEDVVLGGDTEEEREQALADLHRQMRDRAH
ncbi:hypothetical protein [Ramlibacter sp. AN1133]|uniref:hypothetical protein n=1 Tax=Ramlibacter sp. AN1133 TaxID=3133429 RepID=UPI0030C64269